MSLDYRTVLQGLLVLYWIVVVVVLIAEDRDSTTTLAWILILGFLPVVGLVLYFFLGRDWRYLTPRSRRHRAREEVRLPFMRTLWGRSAPAIERFIGARGRCDGSLVGKVAHAIWSQTKMPPLPVTAQEISPSGAAYFPVLLADLAAARDTVDMQYFIWESDKLTDRITEVLLDRLAAGVEVRILNDFFGCLLYDKRGMQRLKAAGAKVLDDVTAIKMANYRNHRKITVIDGRIAHTGGFNLGQEYIDGGARYASWRDTGLRLEGPIVYQLQDLFCQRWFEVAKESLYTERFFPAVPPVPETAPFAQVAAHGVEDYWRAAARAYEVAIGAAQRRVWVQSPYYVPTEAMEEVLVGAALAGVDVQLMITGVPDKRIAWHAAFSYFERLLRAGGHVLLYEGGFFHAKSMVIDDAACAVGTMNLDVRSLDLHKELMVWLYDAASVHRNAAMFEDDRMQCREVTLDELRAIGPLRRFRNSAARLASRLL